jgi:hypothetical protein
MPVDLAVKEVLALRNGESTAYHIMNFDPPTFLEILKAIADDVIVADRAKFGNIFNEKLATMDRELAAVVFSKLSEEDSGTSSAVITSEITEKHLLKMGFGVSKIHLENVFKDFRKGE